MLAPMSLRFPGKQSSNTRCRSNWRGSTWIRVSGAICRYPRPINIVSHPIHGILPRVPHRTSFGSTMRAKAGRANWVSPTFPGPHFFRCGIRINVDSPISRDPKINRPADGRGCDGLTRWPPWVWVEETLRPSHTISTHPSRSVSHGALRNTAITIESSIG